MIEQNTIPMEQAVAFSCGREPVFGIVHTPPRTTEPRSKVGVVFCSAGVRSRLGPCRLYTRFARRLCRAGYHVLRYDPPGIGDSPGDLANVLEYRKRVMECTENNVDAVNFLKSTTGVERIGLVGQCAGAYSAIMAGAAESSVALLILAGLPVHDLGDMSDQAVADVATYGYFRKALKWQSWYKFLTGKSSYRWFYQAICRLVTNRYNHPELSRTLKESFAAFSSAGGKALFVYGSRDELYPPFADGYGKWLRRLDPSGRCHDIHVVEDANHILGQIRWQDELIDRSIMWLNHLVEPPGDNGPKPQPHDQPAGELSL